MATWSPTSLFNRRAHAAENLRPMPQKDFWNTIGTFRTCRTDTGKVRCWGMNRHGCDAARGRSLTHTGNRRRSHREVPVGHFRAIGAWPSRVARSCLPGPIEAASFDLYQNCSDMSPVRMFIVLPVQDWRNTMSILWTIVIGFIVGVIAKFIMPGDKTEPKGFILPTILGILGAFVATALGQSIGTDVPVIY